MKLRFAIPALLLLSCGSALARSGTGLSEPHLVLPASAVGHPRIALTFDACDGKTDYRILKTLIDNRIPATIFVSGKWLKANKAVFDELLARPDLFEIGNHGLAHVPMIDHPGTIYGLRDAGSLSGVDREVAGGEAAIRSAGGKKTRWFRGATAEYSNSAMSEIGRLGYRIAGFSFNADEGATLGAAAVARRMASVRDGDVVIAHINQPHRPSGAGVVKGILALKARGFRFVRLGDGFAGT